MNSDGLNGVDVPAPLAAIAKAITAAYLSSNGNAFTPRTASQIVQENFNPGSRTLEGGPLTDRFDQHAHAPIRPLDGRFVPGRARVR